MIQGRLKSLVIALFVFLCALFIFITSFEKNIGTKVTIVIEAEMYNTISKPMEVCSGTDVSGGEYIQIKPGVGRGWKNEAGGGVDYYLKVDKPAQYIFWARVNWNNACANAFYLNIDDFSPYPVSRYIVGNDPMFGRWHWVKGGNYFLTKGMHHLRISNHDDGVKIDKFLLTNDPIYQPDGFGSNNS